MGSLYLQTFRIGEHTAVSRGVGTGFNDNELELNYIYCLYSDLVHLFGVLRRDTAQLSGGVFETKSRAEQMLGFEFNLALISSNPLTLSVCPWSWHCCEGSEWLMGRTRSSFRY